MNYNSVITFWKLHLQKMGLELKCSLCLNILNQPTLLPCDHMFCGTCIPNMTDSASDCPVCCSHYVAKDVRRTPHIENILNIYKTMEAAIHKISSQKSPQADITDAQIVGDSDHGKGLNQTTHSSSSTPPSFGETKDSDDDRGAEQSAKKLPVQYNLKETGLGEGKRICGISNAFGNEDEARETKRQKLEFGLQNEAAVDGARVQSDDSAAKNGFRSKTETAQKLQNPFRSESPMPDGGPANKNFVCAFCQSSIESEVYGSMMHYLNGKPVGVDKLTHPNIRHVHSKCVDWAPQTYYKGETVINLEVELVRAAKLKCNKCNGKGAALGCVVKSCRKTFHVPCAVYIDECRWDMDDHLVLCPSHSSSKFPSERSKPKKNHEENNQPAAEIEESEKVWETSPGASKEWIICGAALSPSEKNLLLKFSQLTGATLAKAWGPNVTHVIAATNEEGAFSRTLKVLMAILSGKWVLKIDWILACMKAMRPVDEEPYEANLDVYGCRDGPKKGRQRIMEKAPKLFNGLHFYFCGNFDPAYKGYLEELVNAAGGTISEKEHLTSRDCEAEAERAKSLVVYNLDFPPNCEPGLKAFIKKQKHEEAEKIAVQTGSWVVDHTWILESVAGLTLLPFSS